MPKPSKSLTLSQFSSEMKTFEVVRNHYAILGICSPNQSTQKTPISGKVLVGILLFECCIASQLAYIFSEADDFMEYVICICTTVATIATFASFVAIAFNRNLIFRCIDYFGKFIDESELAFNLVFGGFIEVGVKSHFKTGIVYFRTWRPKSEGTSIENKSPCRTIEWNYFNGADERITTGRGFTNMCSQLCLLLLHHFG